MPLPSTAEDIRAATQPRWPKDFGVSVSAWLGTSRATSISRSLAIAGFVLFLAVPFRAGWERAETDFPNYYTAATLVLQHQPLEKYYDWTWFERQMNYAGVERQLGAYTPQTPLTMTPMLALAELPVQRAKQVWLICNLLFLCGTLWMLSRMTRFRMAHIWLLLCLGFYSLSMNVLFGQYYVFLLFLLTFTVYALRGEAERTSGVVAGIAFVLKLYGGPFVVYFAARRKWKAVAGMIIATCCAFALAIVLFGWHGVQYYLTQILPRSLEAGSIDPYSSGVPTFSTMLRRAFTAEPALNPHPLWNAPWLFFGLRTFVALAIVAFASLGLALRPQGARRDFAWFTIAVILLSTSTASYTFVLFLLPVALLLDEWFDRRGLLVVAGYVLLTLPLGPAWLFPKVWLMFALFVGVGWAYWRRVPARLLITVASIIAVLAVADAANHMRQYDAEPGRRFEHIRMGSDSPLASFPAITRFGLFYEVMGKQRYELRWLHEGRMDDISLEGHALYPVALPDGSVAFELVAHRTSRMMRFDPANGTVSRYAGSVPPNNEGSAVSPDGKWIAFTSDKGGPKHLWLRNLATGRQVSLAGGSCNSSWPVWQLDSQAVIFASDCDRAFGLFALYRAPVSDAEQSGFRIAPTGRQSR